MVFETAGKRSGKSGNRRNLGRFFAPDGRLLNEVELLFSSPKSRLIKHHLI